MLSNIDFRSLIGQETCEASIKNGLAYGLGTVLRGTELKSAHNAVDGDGFDRSTKKMKIASLTEEGPGRSIRVDSLMNDEPSRQPKPGYPSSSDYKSLYLQESAKNEQLLQWVAQLQSRLNQQHAGNLSQYDSQSSPPTRAMRAGDVEKLLREGIMPLVFTFPTPPVPT
jgi:hypothetical protein